MLAAKLSDVWGHRRVITSNFVEWRSARLLLLARSPGDLTTSCLVCLSGLLPLQSSHTPLSVNLNRTTTFRREEMCLHRPLLASAVINLLLTNTLCIVHREQAITPNSVPLNFPYLRPQIYPSSSFPWDAPRPSNRANDNFPALIHVCAV